MNSCGEAKHKDANCSLSSRRDGRHPSFPKSGCRPQIYAYNVRRQREERYEDHNNPPLDHTKGPEYVCLPPPGPMDHNEGIGTVWVEKAITHLDLQWAHLWHAPNGSQRVNDAAFKPRIVDAEQSKCLRCVDGAPIIDKIAVGSMSGVEEHHFKRGIESAGIRMMIKRSVGRRRRGGFVDMAAICIFFGLAALLFWGEGGKNKEESKIVNGK